MTGYTGSHGGGVITANYHIYAREAKAGKDLPLQ